jgi:hypothetical protein
LKNPLKQAELQNNGSFILRQDNGIIYPGSFRLLLLQAISKKRRKVKYNPFSKETGNWIDFGINVAKTLKTLRNRATSNILKRIAFHV